MNKLGLIFISLCLLTSSAFGHELHAVPEGVVHELLHFLTFASMAMIVVLLTRKFLAKKTTGKKLFNKK